MEKKPSSPLRIDKKNVFRFLVENANDRNPFIFDRGNNRPDSNDGRKNMELVLKLR